MPSVNPGAERMERGQSLGVRTSVRTELSLITVSGLCQGLERGSESRDVVDRPTEAAVDTGVPDPCPEEQHAAEREQATVEVVLLIGELWLRRSTRA